MRIENFRAIRKTSLSFDDGAVLTGQNDCGISSVLDVLERVHGSMGVMNSRAGMGAILPQRPSSKGPGLIYIENLYKNGVHREVCTVNPRLIH